MSTRLRYIAKVGGEWVGGSQVKSLLSACAGRPLRSQIEIIEAAKTISGAKLWIWREPRKLKHSRSCYAILATRLGILPHFRRKKKTASVVNPYMVIPTSIGTLTNWFISPPTFQEIPNVQQQGLAYPTQPPVQGNVNNDF